MTWNHAFVLKNNTLVMEVDLDQKYPIIQLSNADTDLISNQHRELFRIKIYGKEYSNADFQLESVEANRDETEELITAWYTLSEEGIQVKVHFINDMQDSIRVLYQVYDSYKNGMPYAAFLTIPLLSQLEYKGAQDVMLPPGCQFKSLKGKKILMPLKDYQYSSDIRPPMVLLGQDKLHGFSVTFPSYSDLNNPGCCQNQSKFLTMMETEEGLRAGDILIAPDASFNDTVELWFTGLKKGWAEAFDRYRTYWASSYDFSEYEREDLQWFNDTAIHNFVFFYGKEGFDHKNMKIDVEGLLRQGEEFGGYDTVTIWNQYPRLGVDQRSQWDFHDDFPGGRKAIREAVDQFHAKGVKVLLPYIPWDQGPTETTESMGDDFAKLVADTDADGYQLDTMYDLPYAFRKKTDAIKPGILLQTQFHPTKNHPVEFLTSSWDELWRQDPMPEVDVLRFILPQHIAPQINRWSRYEDKSLMIQRAMFGGAPMVIWQDVFGRWMPFADDQKAQIRKWKEIYLKYRGIYQGPKPIPLYTTDAEGVYCNVFADTAEEKTIYSFYNEGAEDAETTVALWHAGETAVPVLGDCKPVLSNGKLQLVVPARQVVHVLVEKA